MKKYRIRITIALFFLLSITGMTCSDRHAYCAPLRTDEEVERDIIMLQKIHVSLTDGSKTRAIIVKGWLRDMYSGYPDLAMVLLKAIQCPSTGCKVNGEMLPLDVIEGWCKKNRPDHNKIILNHTVQEVQEAYKMTWYEKNGQEEKTLEQILSGN